MVEKLKELIIKYRNDLEKLEAEPSYHEDICNSNQQAIDHSFAVLNQIEELLEKNQIEKANRWIGFVQAILFTNKLYNFSDLNKHHWTVNEFEF